MTFGSISELYYSSSTHVLQLQVGIWDFIWTTDTYNWTWLDLWSKQVKYPAALISSVCSVRNKVFFSRMYIIVSLAQPIAKDICHGVFIGIGFETATNHRFKWDQCHKTGRLVSTCAMFQRILCKWIGIIYPESNHIFPPHPTSDFQSRNNEGWISSSTYSWYRIPLNILTSSAKRIFNHQGTASPQRMRKLL